MSQMPKIPDQFLRDVPNTGFYTARLQRPEEINLSAHAYQSSRRNTALIRPGRYKLREANGLEGYKSHHRVFWVV